MTLTNWQTEKVKEIIGLFSDARETVFVAPIAEILVQCLDCVLVLTDEQKENILNELAQNENFQLSQEGLHFIKENLTKG